MNKPLNCVIVDDEPKAVTLLSDIISRIPELHLEASFTNPTEAMVRIPVIKPDLLFLDIEMPGKNGLELINDILISGCDPIIVFTTGYDQYAIKAIKSHAFDYLLKPIDYQDVLVLVARVNSLKSRSHATGNGFRATKRVKFNTLNGFFIIEIKSIIYIQAEGNYSTLFLNSGESRTVTVKLGEIEEMSLSDQFVRTGRSHIINLDFLTQVDRKRGSCLLKINGLSYTIPINRNGIKLLSEVFG